MSLADEITASEQRTGTPCAVSTTLAAMTPEDAAELQAAIDNPGFKAAAIYRALKRRGVYLSDQSINRHRGQRCRCE